ncbi:unnamed protein product [Staurois parvus]|uniref:Uncharacterized protein n=1 Tax=Staurois parvus TaxID=386267 RepID=A0ABN9BEG3_9NEOB|nr:unnamed protein product [Staurois parvus]
MEVTSYQTPEDPSTLVRRGHINVLNVTKLLHRSQSYHTPEDSHWREVISVF